MPNEDEEENDVMHNLAPSSIQQIGDNLILQNEAERSLPKVQSTPSYEKIKIFHHDDECSERKFHDEAAKLNEQRFRFVNEFLHNIKL